MITQKLNPGDKVTYCSGPGRNYEHGIVKSPHPTDPQRVFVVYKCGGKWEDFQNYTAALTAIDSLEHGWL